MARATRPETALGVIQSTLDNELPYLQRGVELNGVNLVRPVADLHYARDDTHLAVRLSPSNPEVAEIRRCPLMLYSSLCLIFYANEVGRGPSQSRDSSADRHTSANSQHEYHVEAVEKLNALKSPPATGTIAMRLDK